MKKKLNVRKAAIAVVLAVATLIASWSLAAPPPFDYEKAKQLSPEKRHAYDIVVFNELETLGTNSHRYDPDPDYHLRRAEEFERMAADGHFLSYVALRLFDFRHARERHGNDAKAALRQLIEAAESGDESANCALSVMPVAEEIFPYEQRQKVRRRLLPIRMTLKHGACMAYIGGGMLLGNSPDIPLDRKAALPPLFEAARQGYFVAAQRLFSPRKLKSLRDEFDFSDIQELDRALCWGRIVEEHSSTSSFDHFLGELRQYARTNNRPDLVERSKPFDPRLVPITKSIVTPEDCIRLEQGE